MRPAGPEPALQVFETRQDAPHTEVRIDALVIATPVSRATLGLDFQPAETFVGETDLQLGGLGDDGGVRPIVEQDIGGAEARILFIRNRRHQNITG